MRLIYADVAVAKCNEDIEAVKDIPQRVDGILDAVMNIYECPTVDAVPVVRCKDCIHQQKVFHEDKRIKEGGYYICGCELADGYSVVCLDGDFCSRGERRADG